MRKPVQIALVAAVVVLLGATAVLFMKFQQASANYREMSSAEESARSRYAHSIEAIVEIQDSLSAITLGDTTVTMLPGNLQGEQDLSDPDGSRALERIASLRASIGRTKDRIRQLESSLEKSGMEVKGLRRMVANLKKSVSEKEEMVAGLTQRVDSLQTQVAGLETTVEETRDQLEVREQDVENKRRELATVYYVVGSRKDLTQSGVIEAEGGFLGLGKTLQPSGSADEYLFTPLDTDQETVVRIDATRARIVSTQPAASYELKPVEGGLELHITNPEEFRKVKQVIILTA